VVVATAEPTVQTLEARGAQAGEPPRPRTRHEPSTRWVDAGPFRAHLRHLMSVGELDVPEMAVVLGLSTPAVRHLLDGRPDGRVPRRISPRTARRLLLVRTDDVRGLRWCLAPTGAARSALRRQRSEGWSAADVASGVGVDLDELRALEHETHCSRLLAVRLVGLARGLPSTLDDEDLVDVVAAA
jgi:hypothetical protein